jgi:hypothetical protein
MEEASDVSRFSCSSWSLRVSTTFGNNLRNKSVAGIRLDLSRCPVDMNHPSPNHFALSKVITSYEECRGGGWHSLDTSAFRNSLWTQQGSRDPKAQVMR